MWAPYLVAGYLVAGYSVVGYFGCGICDKMQVVYMELTCDGVTTKVANSKFD